MNTKSLHIIITVGYILVAGLIITIALSSCKSKTFQPSEGNSTYISFGNGGGFTGSVKTYYLTGKGEVFAEENDKLLKIRSINKNLTEQCFSNIRSLGLDTQKLNKPGNRYYFIMYSDKGTSNKVVWSGEDNRNENQFLMYDMLNTLIKDK